MSPSNKSDRSLADRLANGTVAVRQALPQPQGTTPQKHEEAPYAADSVD